MVCVQEYSLKNATEAIGGDEIGVDAMEFSPGGVEGESGSGMYFPWNRQNRFAMAGAWSSQGWPARQEPRPPEVGRLASG